MNGGKVPETPSEFVGSITKLKADAEKLMKSREQHYAMVEQMTAGDMSPPPAGIQDLSQAAPGTMVPLSECLQIAKRLEGTPAATAARTPSQDLTGAAPAPTDPNHVPTPDELPPVYGNIPPPVSTQ